MISCFNRNRSEVTSVKASKPTFLLGNTAGQVSKENQTFLSQSRGLTRQKPYYHRSNSVFRNLSHIRNIHKYSINRACISLLPLPRFPRKSAVTPYVFFAHLLFLLSLALLDLLLRLFLGLQNNARPIVPHPSRSRWVIRRRYLCSR